jgi:hypothetical protein
MLMPQLPVDPVVTPLRVLCPRCGNAQRVMLPAGWSNRDSFGMCLHCGQGFRFVPEEADREPMRILGATLLKSGESVYYVQVLTVNGDDLPHLPPRGKPMAALVPVRGIERLYSQDLLSPYTPEKMLTMLRLAGVL